MKTIQKTSRLLALVLLVILTASFTDRDAASFIGSYGVSASDPSQIKLTLRADHSFCYQDYSVPGNKISVKGNWSLKGKKVLLNADGPSPKFHRLWSFEKNGQVAKSRKGLCFYRLGKL